MADRFLLKKFASETNDVGQFGSFQATGGKVGDGVKTTDPDLIQSLPAWKAGWGNAVDNGLLLPRLEEMNGVQRVFAEMLWNQWRDGITFWQAGAPVKALQSIVMYQTGDEFPKLYINKTGVNGTNPPPQDTDNWKPLSDSVGGGEIGDIGFAPLGIDESLNLRRYLNGQVISQSQFVSFTNKVKSAIALYPNLAATETNWQAEKTNSKLGQCGKFVVDDTAGTIRLPCVVNAQGLVDLASIGGIKSESLPNIIGAGIFTTSESASGAVFDSGSAINYSTGSSGNLYQPKNGGLNASRSSSTYKNNAPVQQEAVQYPYYIQVATGIEETLPAIREYEINTPFFFGQSMYSDVAPDNASWLVSNGQWNAKTVYPDYYDWLVEQMNAGVSGFVASTASYTDYDFVINTADQTFRLPLIAERVLVAKKEPTAEDKSWYNLYSDGLLEQGGNSTGWVTNTSKSISLLKPFADTNYSVFLQQNGKRGNNGESNTSVTSKSTTKFSASTGTINTVSLDWKACGYAYIPAQSDFTEVAGLYYYVGDTVQDASLINAGAVLGQLSDKISRTAASDREMVVGWGMPDYSAGITITSGYTASRKGLVTVSMNGQAHVTNSIYINEIRIGYASAENQYQESPVSVQIPVDVGDKVTWTGTSAVTAMFFPFKGV